MNGDEDHNVELGQVLFPGIVCIDEDAGEFVDAHGNAVARCDLPLASVLDVGAAAGDADDAPLDDGGDWQEILDESSGAYYLWNSVTGETKWK